MESYCTSVFPNLDGIKGAEGGGGGRHKETLFIPDSPSPSQNGLLLSPSFHHHPLKTATIKGREGGKWLL